MNASTMWSTGFYSHLIVHKLLTRLHHLKGHFVVLKLSTVSELMMMEHQLEKKKVERQQE